MKIERFTPIHIEFNKWNGFTFEIIGIATQTLEGFLFSISILNNYLIIELLFISFDISLPVKNENRNNQNRI